jgi:hypothetical protein
VDPLGIGDWIFTHPHYDDLTGNIPLGIHLAGHPFALLDLPGEFTPSLGAILFPPPWEATDNITERPLPLLVGTQFKIYQHHRIFPRALP